MTFSATLVHQLRAFEAVNSILPEDRGIHGSIGIGYGDLLVIGDEDLFGTEMNLASKLGEDLACAGEILLSPAAHDALPSDRYRCEQVDVIISGLEVRCHRFQEVIRPRLEGPVVS